MKQYNNSDILMLTNFTNKLQKIAMGLNMSNVVARNPTAMSFSMIFNEMNKVKDLVKITSKDSLRTMIKETLENKEEYSDKLRERLNRYDMEYLNVISNKITVFMSEIDTANKNDNSYLYSRDFHNFVMNVTYEALVYVYDLQRDLIVNLFGEYITRVVSNDNIPSAYYQINEDYKTYSDTLHQDIYLETLKEINTKMLGLIQTTLTLEEVVISDHLENIVLNMIRTLIEKNKSTLQVIFNFKPLAEYLIENAE